MKRFIFTLALFVVAMGLFAEETVIYSNDFEKTPLESEFVDGRMQFGDLWAAAYHEQAQWNPYVATGSEAMSGSQSFCLDIVNPGPEIWGLQFILGSNSIPVKFARQYRVSFKVKSETADNLIHFRVEGTSSTQQYIEIYEANVVQEVSFVTSKMDNPGNGGFKWFFGQISNAGKIWIDDVVITEVPLPSLSSFSENFNSATIEGNILGDFEFGTYPNTTESVWTYGLEVDPKNPSDKYLRLDLGENPDWWAFQFKSQKYEAQYGKKYRIQFKAKSNVANTFIFKVEAIVDFQANITLSGNNQFETFTLETPPMDTDGVPNLLWAFGKPSVVGSTIWLDDIVISEITVPELTELSENFNTSTITDGTLGDFVFGTYPDASTSIWNYTIENDTKNAGNKYLRLEIGENPDWWAFQFKTSKYLTLQGKAYTVQFKAKSSVSNSFRLRVEGNTDFNGDIILSGNDEFETFTVHTPPMDKDGVTNFIFGFGQPTVIGSIVCLDDILITPKKNSNIPSVSDGKVAVLYTDNRLEFPVELQASVQVYDLRGVLVAQGKVGNGVNTLSVKNSHRFLVMKITDNQGGTSVSKALLR